MERTRLDEDLHHREAASVLLRIIDDILDFSKIQLELRPVRVQDLAGIGLYERAAAEGDSIWSWM